MTHKLRSEMSSQKIDTSADIIFGSLTFQEGFVDKLFKGLSEQMKRDESFKVCWHYLNCGKLASVCSGEQPR